ncbi:MAG: asparagine synthase [Planctomycetota bacterium]|jgi:asparagine synthase (glutamine-hydrolysing)
MCGLIGSWHPERRHPAGLDVGLAAIAHRGPDGEGWHDHGTVRLGHRRLSIVDPLGGRQPLHSEDAGLALVHNGEIYNHREILAALPGRHAPRTRSDGEAWLHASEDHGMGPATDTLHGMWALAGSDGERLCLGRDPLGIKPLYWSRHQGGIVFASEIKALLPVVPPESIHAFPPGHRFITGEGLRRHWAPPAGWHPADPDLDPEAWADALLAALDDAVRERLMADVPVGVFLSGGLDSTLVAALMRRHVRDLHSFAVGLPGSSDLERAREVAADLGTIHHEVAIDEGEMLAALPEVVWHLESWDPDLVRSALPCWFVSRAAARTVKVVLTGEGADELFAGYAYHRDYAGPALHAELRRSVANLHHINLQRADRMSMAHGLEARVPFLDTAVVDLALRMPPALKIARGFHKYLLRRAAARLLPPEIAWRAKEQFDHGTGSAEALRRHFGGAEAEAACYRRLFAERFPPGAAWLVARWESDRLDPEAAC